MMILKRGIKGKKTTNKKSLKDILRVAMHNRLSNVTMAKA